MIDIPYRFTGKERDEETGLYYYGARYLDAKTSRWLSTDPALSSYMPTSGGDNSQLPGMGGIYNYVNMHLYHYAGNNPIKYIDPDGRLVSPSGLKVLKGLVGYLIDKFVMPYLRSSPEQTVSTPESKPLPEPEVNMNERFVEEGMKRLGDKNYVWGGKNPTTDGGTDCSGTVEWAAEQASGKAIRTRTANGQATDPNLTIPGDGSRGTLNFYDWNEGGYDHVTIKRWNRNKSVWR